MDIKEFWKKISLLIIIKEEKAFTHDLFPVSVSPVNLAF